MMSKNVSPWEHAVATYKFTYAIDNKFFRPGDIKANLKYNPKRLWERCLVLPTVCNFGAEVKLPRRLISQGSSNSKVGV